MHLRRRIELLPPALLSHRGLRSGAFGMPATYLGLPGAQCHAGAVGTLVVRDSGTFIAPALRDAPRGAAYR